MIPDSSPGSKKRIAALVHPDISSIVKKRKDLSINDIPIIWIEIQPKKGKTVLACRVYRTWGLRQSQRDQIKIICSTIRKHFILNV